MIKIPFNKFNAFYLSNKNEILNIADKVLASGNYIRGDETNRLESKLCKITKRKHALLTSSCTDALYLSLKALGIKKGDEVILPVFSYIASLSPILMCDATPVFVDINPTDLMSNIDKIKQSVTSKTKAIIFVQLFGNIANLKNLEEFAKSKHIALIEDNAQGIGSSVDGIPSGSFGDFSCISFDATKVVSAFGTGGVILTDNSEYYSTLKKLIHHGRNDLGEFEILGYNSKIPEFNVALINQQLEKLNDYISEVNIIAQRFYKNLESLKEITILKPSQNVISNFHKFVILANDRDKLQDFLSSKNIATKIHYEKLLCEHQLLKPAKNDCQNFPIANSIKQQVLSLPIYPTLTIDEIDYICENITKHYSL